MHRVCSHSHKHHAKWEARMPFPGLLARNRLWIHVEFSSFDIPILCSCVHCSRCWKKKTLSKTLYTISRLVCCIMMVMRKMEIFHSKNWYIFSFKSVNTTDVVLYCICVRAYCVCCFRIVCAPFCRMNWYKSHLNPNNVLMPSTFIRVPIILESIIHV